MKKNLILIGMMAVGKTTLGKIVAKKQGLEFFDADRVIEKKNEMIIKDIFAKKGEKFFRSEEKKVVFKLLKKTKCVIALGGGAFINKDIRQNVLKKGISIWLDVDSKILYTRSLWSQKRPLLNKNNNKKKLDELYLNRKNIYKLADHKITCDKLPKSDIAKKIIELYEKH